MEYKVVSAISYFDLEEAVNFWITHCWKPQGGVCVFESCLYQAMVRENGK